LRLGRGFDGRTVEAKVSVAEVEIEGGRGPLRILAFKEAMPIRLDKIQIHRGTSGLYLIKGRPNYGDLLKNLY